MRHLINTIEACYTLLFLSLFIETEYSDIVFSSEHCKYRASNILGEYIISGVACSY